MNQEDRLDPEIGKLVRDVKLKELSEEEMSNYVSEVRTRISRHASSPVFGFPQLGLLLAVGFILAGLVYFIVIRPQVEKAPSLKEVSLQHQTAQTSGQPPLVQKDKKQEAKTQKQLSIEESITVLETFGEEFSDEASDLYRDDDILKELAFLDEVELSSVSSAQVQRV